MYNIQLNIQLCLFIITGQPVNRVSWETIRWCWCSVFPIHYLSNLWEIIICQIYERQLFVQLRGICKTLNGNVEPERQYQGHRAVFTRGFSWSGLHLYFRLIYSSVPLRCNIVIRKFCVLCRENCIQQSKTMHFVYQAQKVNTFIIWKVKSFQMSIIRIKWTRYFVEHYDSCHPYI